MMGRSFRELVIGVFETLTERAERSGENVEQVRLGPTALDSALGEGLQHNTRYLIVGDVGVGKTAALIHLALCAARGDVRVRFVPSTSEEAAAQRILGQHVGIPHREFERTALTARSWERMTTACAELSNWPIEFVSSPVAPGETDGPALLLLDEPGRDDLRTLRDTRASVVAAVRPDKVAGIEHLFDLVLLFERDAVQAPGVVNVRSGRRLDELGQSVELRLDLSTGCLG